MQPQVALPEAEENAQHRSAIESISEQHHLAPEQVAALYERELACLRQDALITSYLSIFVTRRVVELLRQVGAPLTPLAPPTARESGLQAIQ